MADVILPLARTVFLPAGSPALGEIKKIEADIRDVRCGMVGADVYCLGEMDLLVEYCVAGRSGALLASAPLPEGAEWQALLSLPFHLRGNGDLPTAEDYRVSVAALDWSVVTARAIELYAAVTVGAVSVAPEKKQTKGGEWKMVSNKETDQKLEINSRLKNLPVDRRPVEIVSLGDERLEDNIKQVLADVIGEALPVAAPPDAPLAQGLDISAIFPQFNGEERTVLPVALPAEAAAAVEHAEKAVEHAEEAVEHAEEAAEHAEEAAEHAEEAAEHAEEAAEHVEEAAEHVEEAAEHVEEAAEHVEEAAEHAMESQIEAEIAAAEYDTEEYDVVEDEYEDKKLAPIESVEMSVSAMPAIEDKADSAAKVIPPLPAPKMTVMTDEPKPIAAELSEAASNVMPVTAEIIEPELIETASPAQKKRRPRGVPNLYIEAHDNDIELTAFKINIKL